MLVLRYARRGDVFTQRVGDSLTAVNKKKQLKTFTSELGKLMESDPDIADTFMRAFAESNEVHTLEALNVMLLIQYLTGNQ